MKQYLQNLQAKSTHEQRAHAVRISGIVTVAVFFVWLTAIGVQLSFTAFGPTKPVADGQTVDMEATSANESLLANVLGAIPGLGSGASASGSNTLEVATSSDQTASLVSTQ